MAMQANGTAKGILYTSMMPEAATTVAADDEYFSLKKVQTPSKVGS